MEELNLKDLLKYFLSKWLILFIVIAVCVVSICIYTIFFKTPMYQSYSTVVLAGINSNSDSTSITQSDVTLNKNLISTYQEIIKSRRIMNQVIENLGLNISYESLTSRVSVTSENDTELIRITVTYENANTAKLIVDEIAKVFSTEIKDIYNIQNITVIDKGEVSNSAYNINIAKTLVLAVLIGFVLSAAIIFIMFYFDTTIKSVDEVEEKVGLPILGTIPDMSYLGEDRE